MSGESASALARDAVEYFFNDTVPCSARLIVQHIYSSKYVLFEPSGISVLKFHRPLDSQTALGHIMLYSWILFFSVGLAQSALLKSPSTEAFGSLNLTNSISANPTNQ